MAAPVGHHYDPGMSAAFYANFMKGHLVNGVEQHDIDMMASDWLTDTCIRQVIHRHQFLIPNSRVILVDPAWFFDWAREREKGNAPETIPEFLIPPPGTTLAGLAIPFNEGQNHWTTIYVNLEARGAIYFNTLYSAQRTFRVRELMTIFFQMYEPFFAPGGEFRFLEDPDCPQQGDAYSCGIYVVANVVDLLGIARPRTQRLTREEIRVFRENGVRWLREAPRVESFPGWIPPDDNNTKK